MGPSAGTRYAVRSDPLRVLGHRLRPWAGRLSELPAALDRPAGDYRAWQAARVAERVAVADRARPHHPTSTAAAREAARAQLAAALAARAQRATSGAGDGTVQPGRSAQSR